MYKTGYALGQSITTLVGDSSSGSLPIYFAPCFPTAQCWNGPENKGLLSNTTRCTTNFPVSQYITSAKGGSLVLSTTTSGVTGVGLGCNAFNGSLVRVRYTLSGTHKTSEFPTPMPTLSPNAAASIAGGAASVQALVTSGGTPFYLIAGFAVVYAMLGVFVVRLRDVDKSLVQLPIIGVMAVMALLGSGFVSEMFLVALMLESSAFKTLGIVILCARLLHVFATLYVLLRIIGTERWTARYAALFNSEHLICDVKVYGFVMLLSFVDVPLVRFLPWKNTEFARQSKGMPDLHMYSLCLCVKLVQSVITMVCQFVFIAQVNSTYIDSVSATAKAFLGVNLGSTFLMTLLNIVAASISIRLLQKLDDDPSSKLLSPSNIATATAKGEDRNFENNVEMVSGHQQGAGRGVTISSRHDEIAGSNPMHATYNTTTAAVATVSSSTTDTSTDTTTGVAISSTTFMSAARFNRDVGKMKENMQSMEERARLAEEEARLQREKTHAMEEKLRVQDEEIAYIKNKLLVALSSSSSSFSSSKEGTSL